MIPGTQETGTPQTGLDRRIEQHLITLKLTEAKQNGALYFNHERALAAFKTMKGSPEGAVPVVEGRIRELSKK